MTSKNSVDTIIYEILKEIPDRDTICALDFGLISLAVQQATCFTGETVLGFCGVSGRSPERTDVLIFERSVK